MSVHALKWAWDQTGIGPRPKAVLVAVANHADEDGAAWPTINSLMHMTSQSRSSVKRCLEDLIDKNLICSEPDFDKSGRRISNVYRLLAPAEALKPVGAKPSPPHWRRRKQAPTPPESIAAGTVQAEPGPVQKEPGMGQSCDPGMGHGGTGHGSTVDHAEEPLSEPPIDRSNEKAGAAVSVDQWDEFWRIYPHPEGDPTKPAHEAWLETIEGGVDPAMIIGAAKLYAARKPKWQSSVQARRWLTEGRWSDWELPAKTKITATLPQFAYVPAPEDRSWFDQRWLALPRIVGATRFQVFLAKLTVLEIGAEEIRFGAPTKFISDYVQANLCDDVGRTMGRAIHLEVQQQGTRP